MRVISVGQEDFQLLLEYEAAISNLQVIEQS